MNQALKDRVYRQGNRKLADYLAITSEMNDLEREVFSRLRLDQTDLQIISDLHLSPKTYEKIEDSVGRKLTWAILYCVDFTMRNDR